jgi:hypothetical protein
MGELGPVVAKVDDLVVRVQACVGQQIADTQMGK